MTLPSSQAPLVAGPPPPDSPLFNGAQIKGGAAPAEPTKIRPLCLLLPGVSKGAGGGRRRGQHCNETRYMATKSLCNFVIYVYIKKNPRQSVHRFRLS